MHPDFLALIESMQEKFECLMACSQIQDGLFPKTNVPKQGVYLFCENGIPLYVGRSNRLRSRYGGHCNKGSTHNTAAFAMKLAREATGKMVASYIAGKDDRKTLMLDPIFKQAFDEAKARIRKMDYRCVEETDQTKQALLEIYCTVVLKTKYNDFDTH